MRITDAFLGEHAVLYAVFSRIEERLQSEVDTGTLRLFVDVLDAALVSHAQLENSLLFDRLEPIIGASGPLSVMRAEHESIEGAIHSLSRVDDAEAAKRTLLQAVQTAREHFAKEEQILFPIAGKVLDQDSLESTGDEWAGRRRVTVAAEPSCGS